MMENVAKFFQPSCTIFNATNAGYENGAGSEVTIH
jgi:hypothetical protein